MADVPPAQPPASCVRNRDPKHVVSWYRTEGWGPWVCHICHPCPHRGLVHVGYDRLARIVQITLDQAARFVSRPVGQETVTMPP